MTPTLRALHRELATVRRRLAKVKELMEANPAGRIIELRREAQRVIEQHGATSALTAELIADKAAEEKRQFALAKRQTNPKIYAERLELEAAVRDLEWNIGLLEMRQPT